jgi:hypothetical protein
MLPVHRFEGEAELGRVGGCGGGSGAGVDMFFPVESLVHSSGNLRRCVLSRGNRDVPIDVGRQARCKRGRRRRGVWESEGE